MSEKTYTITTKMNSAYCDYRGQARLSYLLALSQEIATQHVAHIGMGDSFLRPMGKAFIMAKLHMELFKAPAAEQDVVVTTLDVYKRQVRNSPSKIDRFFFMNTLLNFKLLVDYT